MSIILNSLNMPTERENFNLTIKYNGIVLDTETGMQVAEAYELPPHGRLIDADKLCELCDIMADNSDDIFKSIWNQFKITVEWCPTIIPAGGG